MKKKIHFVFLCVTSLLLIASCTRDNILTEDSEIIQRYVSAFTSGEISRESIVRIQFLDDVADSGKVNAVLKKSPIRFDPAIKGYAIWTDTRMLEFHPDMKLTCGQNYTATLDLYGLIKYFVRGEKFRFEFATIKQTFEVELDGLKASDRIDSRQQQLSGKIITADSENGIDIEKILHAGQEGKDLEISWTHNPSRIEHSFIVSGIMRNETQSEVILTFDGGPIGIERKDVQNIVLPPIDKFAVSQVRPVIGETQYVEIRFTDQLEKNQNLDGLIQVGSIPDLRYTIENNIVRVYCSTAWPAEVNVNIIPGIRNINGRRLESEKLVKIDFEEIKPQVRFAGNGVILPTSQGATIPIETVNLNAVIIEAVRIHEDNISQFFQVNSFDGIRELNRVGKVVWKKTVPLNFTPEKKNRWVRYGLDVEPLIQSNPGEIYRITLTFERSHIVYDSPRGRIDWDEAVSRPYIYREYYDQRNNPYHPAYYRRYRDHEITISRGLLVSDIGIIAKSDSYNNVLIAVTDLKSTEPLPNVSLKLLDFQQQIISSAETNNEGIALFSFDRTPFLVVATHGNQKGYLKLDEMSALSYSHFDVAGKTVKEGIKG